jgi:tetratricopeptide (TPR) repeat protein
MNLIAQVVFYLWIPVIIFIFSKLPARRAAVVALITGWLFLPQAIIEMPGIPDYKRTTATSVGVFLGLLAFAPGRIRALQPRWFDLPMIIWCFAPSMSSLANDLGPYDAAACLLDQLVTWGLPYLVGRACLGDAEGLKELGSGIVIGGLVYVPLTLIEMRMSPQIHSWVYGFAPSSFVNVVRFGGYRPVVFMRDGLELGMWMVAASLTAYWLWAGGVLKRIRGIPFIILLALLVVITILCKSTGAILLMFVGIAILWSAVRLRTRLAVWVLLLLTPLYCEVRATGQWDGKILVNMSKDSAGEERAGSLEFRLANEDMLAEKALQRPVFGWAGWGQARVYDKDGKDLTITDGFWIIALGNYGIVGLTSITLVFLLPLTWFALKFPPRTWNAPGLAPAAVLSVLLTLYMIDNLSNGMINLIYITASGALLGALPKLEETEHSSEIGHSFGHALELEAAAEAATGTEEHDLFREAERAWKAALEPPDGDPSIPPDRDQDRAQGYSRLGQCLLRLERHREAAEALAHALELRAAVMDRAVDDPAARQSFADALEELAWVLATTPDPAVRNPARAVTHASQAARLFPENPSYHRILGAGLCRLGDWPAAILALGRASALSRGGDPFDHLLMAIALAGRGDLEAAKESLGRAERVVDARVTYRPEWQLLHAEAVARVTADLVSAGEVQRQSEGSSELPELPDLRPPQPDATAALPGPPPGGP